MTNFPRGQMTFQQVINEVAHNIELGVNGIAWTARDMAKQLGLPHGSHETKQSQEVMPPMLEGEDFVEYEKRIQTEAFNRQRARQGEVLRTSRNPDTGIP